MYLYHLTPKKNLVNILTDCLRTNPKSIYKGITCGSPRRFDNYRPIWFTDDPLYIVETQIGIEHTLKYQFNVLTFDMSMLMFNYKIHKHSEHEWICFDNVSCDNIFDIKTFESFMFFTYSTKVSLAVNDYISKK